MKRGVLSRDGIYNLLLEYEETKGKEIETIEIACNEDTISFDEYISRLFEIREECNHEHYLAEVIIPFLRSCCFDDMKIVPVFDDRATGPQTYNDTEIKKRMRTICAAKEDGKYANVKQKRLGLLVPVKLQTASLREG